MTCVFAISIQRSSLLLRYASRMLSYHPLFFPLQQSTFCALLIFKKQMLFVYTPEYQSGGDHYPVTMDWTLVCLICAQFTFVGFVFLR